MRQQPSKESIQRAAIDAYLSQRDDVPQAVRLYGAALCFQGIADNGGLMGGGIENCREADDTEAIADAVAAFRLFGLEAVADLIVRADLEYARMRPDGAAQEISAAGDSLWRSLDEQWFALDAAARLDLIAFSIHQSY